MPTRPPRPCIVCGTLTRQSRCSAHRTPYDGAERRRMAAAVQSWIAAHGTICMGHGRGAHMVAARELTADHVIPISQGGAGGPLRVLCRSCNSRRGAEMSHGPAA